METEQVELAALAIIGAIAAAILALGMISSLLRAIVRETLD